MNSLTGDPVTDAVVPDAVALVWAVKTEDAEEVAAILAACDPTRLSIVLAAMVPDDQPPSALLSWRLDPAEYRRLRTAGVDAVTAMTILRGRHSPTSAA